MSGGPETHGGLLRAGGDFRLLFFATLASSIGTWLAAVALVVDVFDRTGSPSWVSALLIAEFAPLVAFGLLAGALLDRFSRRKAMVAADVVRAVVFCVLPFTTGPLQIVLLALAAGAATSLFRPAAFAGLPNLVPDPELPRANALLQSGENLTLALGPLIGGLLVAWAGPDPAYLLNAGSFVVSALLILRIRGTLERERATSEGHWRDVAAGLALVRQRRGLLAVVVVWSIALLASGGTNVAEIVLAKEVFDAGDEGFGFMLAAMGAGLVLGSFLGGGWLARQGVRATYSTAIALMAVGMGAVAVSPNVWLALPLLVVAGVGNGTAVVCNAVLIQRDVPDRLRGRAFTLAMSLTSAAFGIGMIAAGPLTEGLGAREVWVIAAGLLAAAALAAGALTRGVERASEPRSGPRVRTQQGA